MSYSAKSTGVPLNELVSTTSQPTSRNAGVDVLDRVGSGDQKVLVTAFEAQTAKVVERQVLDLQVRPHCAVKDDDAFF